MKCLSTILWSPSASSYLMPHWRILIQSLVFALSCEAGGLKYISIYLLTQYQNQISTNIEYESPICSCRYLNAALKLDETEDSGTYCSWRTFSELNSSSMEVFNSCRKLTSFGRREKTYFYYVSPKWDIGIKLVKQFCICLSDHKPDSAGC